MVRVIRVFCPAMDRVAFAVPFANLANAAICGWATQLETRISSRFVSYAIVCGLPIIGAGLSAGALRMTRNGGTSPAAVRLNTVAAWFPKFAIHSSSFFGSYAIPVGFLIIVLGPLSVRIGATSPLASAL